MHFPANTHRQCVRNRMVPTLRFQNLKCCRGNCMRLFRCCTHYGALHPIRGYYTRSERVQCSLMGCTPPSTTSSIADALPRRYGHHDQDRCSTPAQQSFRQSADPLSKNSQISRIFSEWVYGLANATAWNHYAHTHKPTQPASSNS